MAITIAKVGSDVFIQDGTHQPVIIGQQENRYVFFPDNTHADIRVGDFVRSSVAFADLSIGGSTPTDVASFKTQWATVFLDAAATALSTVTTSTPITGDGTGGSPVTFTADATHRLVTDTEKTTWNAAVPNTRTVNGHALSADVTVSKSDVGLGNVPNTDATVASNITQDSTHRFATDAEKTSCPKEYWVSTAVGSSDANDGSRISPFATISHALSVISSGAAPAKLYIGYGTWTISSVMTLPDTYPIHIMGLGRGITIIQFAASVGNVTSIFNFNSTAGGSWTFESLTLDGNMANNTDQGSNSQRGISIINKTATTSTLTVRNVTIQNFWGYGMLGYGWVATPTRSLNVVLDNVQVSGCNRHGIITNYTSLLQVRGGYSNGSLVGEGLNYDNCSVVSVDNFGASNNSQHGICGVTATTTTTTCTYLAFANCICNGNGVGGSIGFGICVTAGAKYVSVTGNVCDGNLNGGICFDAAISGNSNIIDVVGSVTGNVCSNSTNGSGIKLEHVRGLCVTGNTFYGNQNTTVLNGNGIKVASCLDLTLGPNVCFDNAKYSLYLSNALGTETYGGIAVTPGRFKGIEQIHSNNNTVGETFVGTGLTSLSGTVEVVDNKDTDGTLAANSDTKYASQKATKTYADTKVPSARTVSGQALSANIDLRPRLFTVSGSNVTTTLATAVDITGFVVSVEANKKYKIVGAHRIGCDNTGGVRFTMSAPSGATIQTAIIAGSSTSVGASAQTMISAFGTLTATPLNRVNAATGMASLIAFISIGSTAGNVVLQFASANAGETSSVFIGSALDVTEIV